VLLDCVTACDIRVLLDSQQILIMLYFLFINFVLTEYL
jgi:hypothetical protein